MSKITELVLAFGEWAPDSPDIIPGNLDKVVNLAPHPTGLTPLSRPVNQGPKVTDGPVNNTHVGLRLLTNTLRVAADGVNGTPTWYEFPASEANEWEPVSESQPNDEDGIRSIEDKEIIYEIESPAETPVATTDHVIEIRYEVYNQTGTWFLDIELGYDSGGTFTSFVPAITRQETGTGETGGVIYKSWTLTGAEATLVSADYTILLLKVNSTIGTRTNDQEDLVVDEDKVTGDWEDQDGDETGLFDSIDEDPVDDDTWIRTPAVQAAESSYYQGYVKLTDTDYFPYIEQGHTPTITVRIYGSEYDAADQPTMEVRLYQFNPDGVDTLIASNSWNDVTTTVVEKSYTLTAGESANVDWEAHDNGSKPLYLHFEFTAPTALSGEQYKTVNAVVSKVGGDWQDEDTNNSNADLVDGVDDDPTGDNDGDLTFAESPFTSGDYECIFQVEEIEKPQDGTEDSLFCYIYARIRGGVDDIEGKFTLLNGDDASEIASTEREVIVRSAWTKYTIEVPPDSFDAINDWADLHIKMERFSGGDGRLAVTQFKFVAPEGGYRGYLTHAKMDSPPASTMDLTWFQITYPHPDEDLIGDKPVIVMGTETKLYEVDATQFNDITRLSGDYAQGTEAPGAWNFADWGEWVIATNFVDVPQIWRPGDSEFSSLFDTSDEEPQGRIVSANFGFLILWDLNPNAAGITGSITGDMRSYTGWSSQFGNPRKFDLNSFDNQSVYFQVASSPGGIVQAISGEPGLILKRGAVHRIDYVNLPNVFDLPIISRYGTPWPLSVVSAPDGDYWIGNEGICWCPPTKDRVELISTGKVSLFLNHGRINSDILDYSITPVLGDSRAAVDTHVFGAYNYNSGHIFWFWKTSGDTDNQFHRGLCLDTVSKKVSLVDISETGTPIYVSSACGIPNPQYFESAEYFDSFALARWDGTNTRWYRMASNQTLNQEIKTGVVPATILGARPGTGVTIHSITPLLEDASVLMDLDITIEFGDNAYLTKSSTTSVSYNYVELGANGEMRLLRPISGKHFRFTVDLPSTSIINRFKDFKGLLLEVEMQRGLSR